MISLWSAVAGAASVQVVLEPRELEKGQVGRARVIVAYSGAESVDASKAPEVSGGDGVQLRFSGQTGRSNRVVNGRIQKTVEFTYTVAALREGAFDVGPVQLDVSGSHVASQPVRLTVTPRTQGGGEDEFEAFAGFQVGGVTSPAVEVWEGQVLTYRRGLRYRSQVSARFHDPDLDGFRTLQSGDPVEQRYVLDDAKGQVGVTEGLLPVVASGVGRHDLGPVTVAVQIPVGRRFGLVETRTEVFATDPLSLAVRPLPPAPPGFSGIVGDVEVTAPERTARVAVGEGIPFVVVVSGSADLDGLRLPDPVVPGASVYPQEPVVRGGVTDGELAASATFTWTLVPTVAGPFEPPPYELVVFSPSKGAFETRSVRMPHLDVAPGADGDAELRAFGDPTSIDAAPADAPVPPYSWGLATRLDPTIPLGLASVGALVPAAGLLLGDALRAARRRRRVSAPVDRPPTPIELLASLPADPEERLMVLDQALRLAEGGRDDGRARDLRKRLGRARFGGGDADPALEADIRRLCEVLQREAA